MGSIMLTLALAAGATGGLFSHRGECYPAWLPLGADRTPEYYFQRHFALPPVQLFPGLYYNPYVMRGERYLPYSGCGGCHPAGGPPSPTWTPVTPSRDLANDQPVVTPPTYSGRVEVPPENTGSGGMLP